MDKTQPTVSFSKKNSPTVYTTERSVKPNKKWYQTWRIIYPILGAVVIVELILGLKTLLTPLPQPKQQKVQPISAARILLLSQKNNYKVGEIVPVTARVFTAGNFTVGTDLILQYDPKLLDASSSAFTKGSIYTDYPMVKIDNETGVVIVSGVSSIANKGGYNGMGELGIVNFKAKAVGQTTLTVDFKPGSTDDSNVIESTSSRDILGSVYNLKLTIQ